MEITSKNLDRFTTWLVDRGRSEDTATLYTYNLRSCAAHAKGLTHRLIAGELAPNSLRTNLAALRAWAKFSKDDALRDRLSDIRLPPARRVTSKIPLSQDDWKRAVKHLTTCQVAEPMRAVLCIMAKRGLRCGDVLRIRHPDVTRALATGKLVYEGKGRKRIEISARPILTELEALAKHRGWDRVRDLVCARTSARRTAGKKVWRAAKRTAKQIGIADMTPHRYRHTFATNYLKALAGDPNAIVKLQKFMAWESMGTAARYVDNVSQDELDAIGQGLVESLA